MLANWSYYKTILGFVGFSVPTTHTQLNNASNNYVAAGTYQTIFYAFAQTRSKIGSETTSHTYVAYVTYVAAHHIILLRNNTIS